MPSDKTDKVPVSRSNKPQVAAASRAGNPEPELALISTGMVASVYALGKRPLTIGRDEDNDVVIEDTLASKKHATVSVQDRLVIVEDMGSRNGTRVNEKKVLATVLRPGDIIRIGRSFFVLLTRAMPIEKKGKVSGWIIVTRENAGKTRVRLMELPLLFGRAPETNVRITDVNVADFHVQITASEEGAQVIQLAPAFRVFSLTQTMEIKVAKLTLGFQPVKARSKEDASVGPVRVELPRTASVPDEDVMDFLAARSSQFEDKQVPTAKPGFKRILGKGLKCRVTGRRGKLAGKSFLFFGEPLTIGRDEKASVRIEEDGVSRRHARIHGSEGDIVIEDLESENGTFVNGAQVRRCPLKPGDLIKIGSCEFLVHL